VIREEAAVVRRRLVGIAACLSLLATTAAAQTPINADSIEVHGVVLVMGIDTFVDGPSEPPRVELILVNESDSTVTIPGNGLFCPLTFIDETWCRPDSTECLELSTNECLVDVVRSVPPGRTRYDIPRLLHDTWPSSGSWIHTFGRVRMRNPWGYPWPNGPDFELAVSFRRAALLPIQPARWGTVKRLYRD
jgi:hypothetical protein